MSTQAPQQPRSSHQPARAQTQRHGDALTIHLEGDWKLHPDIPDPSKVTGEIASSKTSRIDFETSSLGAWNSSLISYVSQIQEFARERQVEVSSQHLPSGVQKLIQLAAAVPEAKDTKQPTARQPWIARLGALGIRFTSALRAMLEFAGESSLAFLALLRGKAQFRWRDAALVMQRSGPEALCIVALINFLVGVILAFVGAVQLSRFGAAIFVADLVAIGTVREMACLMTGIIVCGRTGAAFAAELGSMKVNEEISAFKAFGISPMEFLVLPRLLGLFLMMPLLCIFADLIMIFGGFVICVSLLDVTATEYINRTLQAITTRSFLLGIFKAAVFGVLVAGFGCLRGMQSGSNAAGVGQATTSAVVSGITAIVVADGIFAVLCDALGI